MSVERFYLGVMMVLATLIVLGVLGGIVVSTAKGHYEALIALGIVAVLLGLGALVARFIPEDWT